MKAEYEPTAAARASTLGDRIRRARMAQRMTLGEIAEALGVAKPSAWAWEHDKARPTPDKLEVLAGVLNITIEDLDPRTPVYSSLTELISECRDRIGHAAGVRPEDVTIILSFGNLAAKDQFVGRTFDSPDGYLITA